MSINFDDTSAMSPLSRAPQLLEADSEYIEQRHYEVQQFRDRGNHVFSLISKAFASDKGLEDLMLNPGALGFLKRCLDELNNKEIVSGI